MQSGIIICSRKEARLATLKRITSHLRVRRKEYVESLGEADLEIMRRTPHAVILDISDYAADEFERIIEPFILQLPGWIKIYLVDANPSRSWLAKVRGLGVTGYLKSPMSHYGVSHMIQHPVDSSESE